MTSKGPRTSGACRIGSLVIASMAMAIFIAPVLVSSVGAQEAARPAAAPQIDPLIGLWKARLNFGPDPRGPMILAENSRRLAGRFCRVRVRTAAAGQRPDFHSARRSRIVPGQARYRWRRSSRPMDSASFLGQSAVRNRRAFYCRRCKPLARRGAADRRHAHALPAGQEATRRHAGNLHPQPRAQHRCVLQSGPHRAQMATASA